MRLLHVLACHVLRIDNSNMAAVEVVAIARLHGMAECISPSQLGLC